jgi:hypothetical protein
MQSTFLDLDLLEAQAILGLIKVVQTRPCPVLVSLGIVLLEVAQVLCQFFQNFLFELALDLTRVGATGGFEVLAELPALRRRVGLDVLTRRWCIDEHTLLRLGILDFGGRHLCGSCGGDGERRGDA